MYKEVGNSVPLSILKDFIEYLHMICVENIGENDFDGCFISRISFRGFKLELDEETCLWELVNE